MRGSGLTRLLAVTMALVVGACGGPAASSTPGATAAPSPSTAGVVPTAAPPSAAQSIEPSIEPSIPAPTSTPGQSLDPATYVQFPEFAYVDKFAMRVAVNDLNVRRKPDTSGISEGKAPKGELFMVYDWPISAVGYTWYYGYEQLQDDNIVPKLPQPYSDGYDEVLGGWMAAGTEDTPFLVPVGPRCPTTRDLRNVAAMLGSERVACFGSDSLTLEGVFGCEGCGGAAAGVFEPDWLASPLELGFLSTQLVDGIALALHFQPGGPGAPPQGARVRVRGHFADDRSSTCRITELGAGDELNVPIANAAAEQWCRSKFVVESYEVIG